MKPLMLLLVLIWVHIACAVDIDLSKLREAEGDNFKAELERLAGDASTVQTLRVSGLQLSVRDELIRELVLARADHPEIFKEFQKVIDLAREGSPIWDERWSLNDAANRHRFNYISSREGLITRFMWEWAKSPLTAESIIERYKKSGVQSSQRQNEVAMAERMWPAMAFGVSSDEKRVRYVVCPVLQSWSRNSLYSENSLESMRWLCERTDYDVNVVLYYVIMVNQALESQIPAVDKPRLVTRSLSDLLHGDKFRDVNNTIGINFTLDCAERHGNSTHVPILRRLADTPLWSAYRNRMLQVAETL